MENPLSPNFGIVIPCDTLLAIIFYVSLFIVAVYGIVLFYHWQQYSVDAKASLITYSLYFGLTGVLLTIMGIVIFL